MFASTLLSKAVLTAASLTTAPAASDSGAAIEAPLTSYTQAYNAADGRPMLVVLNPGDGTGIDVATLREDARLDSSLSGYVVAEIDVTTEHGAQVHDLFKSPSLPHVVVIDADRKQVYKSSGSVTADGLRSALAGSPSTVTSMRPVVETASVTLPTRVPAASQPMPVESATLSTALPPVYSSPLPAAPPKCVECEKARARRLQMQALGQF